MVRICDHVGIMLKDYLKVCCFNSISSGLSLSKEIYTITLDNASNNKTLCKEVEHPHNL